LLVLANSLPAAPHMLPTDFSAMKFVDVNQLLI